MGTILALNVGLLTALLVFTVLTERTTEQTLKIFPFLDHKKWFGIPSPLLVALFWASVFAWGGGINFFAVFGLTFQWAWIGLIVTSILMTGGSSGVHFVINSTVQETTNAATTVGAFGSGPGTRKPETGGHAVSPDTGLEQGGSGVPPGSG